MDPLDTAQRLNRSERLLAALDRLRGRLPGDAEFGDPLSTAGKTEAQLAGRALAELRGDRSVLKEAGFGALQVWQALSERQGRGRGDEELTLVFTDLVGFSDWALRAGDEAAVELLRSVSLALEPAVRANRGRVVKRLGDGLMATFLHPADALDALTLAQDGLETIEVAGFRPRMRAGIHVGRPRRIGGDLLGVDVNVAARVADGAGPGEVLVTDAALALLDTTELTVRKKRWFRAKGMPRDVTVHAVSTQ